MISWISFLRAKCGTYYCCFLKKVFVWALKTSVLLLPNQVKFWPRRVFSKFFSISKQNDHYSSPLLDGSAKFSSMCEFFLHLPNWCHVIYIYIYYSYELFMSKFLSVTGRVIYSRNPFPFFSTYHTSVLKLSVKSEAFLRVLGYNILFWH